jgi:uncharacterized protein YukE
MLQPTLRPTQTIRSAVFNDLNEALTDSRDAIKEAKELFNETLENVEKSLGVDLPVEPLRMKRRNKKKPGL